MTENPDPLETIRDLVTKAIEPQDAQDIECFLNKALHELDSLQAMPAQNSEYGTRYRIEHDGFQSTVIGHYKRLDGYEGVVMQQDGTKIVHVYGKKWLKPISEQPAQLLADSSAG